MLLSDAALALGATARTTRFVVQDDLGGTLLRVPAWRWAKRSKGYGRWRIAEALDCPWCVSVWAAAAVLGGYAAARAVGAEDVWRFGAGILTLAYAAGYVEAAALEDSA